MSQKIEYKRIDFKAEAVTEGGFIEGYAAIFGNKDAYGDIIVKGAFKNSLSKKSAAKTAFLWGHNPNFPIGKLIDVFEDDVGLKYKAKFVMEAEKAKSAYALAKEDALGGASIGYLTVKSTFDEKTGIRTITEVDLWEISLVTFPANPLAVMTDIKSTPSKRLIEETLTQDAGLSRKQARLLLSGGFKAAFPMQDAEEGDETEDNTQDAVEEKSRLYAEIKTTLKLMKER